MVVAASHPRISGLSIILARQGIRESDTVDIFIVEVRGRSRYIIETTQFSLAKAHALAQVVGRNVRLALLKVVSSDLGFTLVQVVGSYSQLLLLGQLARSGPFEYAWKLCIELVCCQLHQLRYRLIVQKTLVSGLVYQVLLA